MGQKIGQKIVQKIALKIGHKIISDMQQMSPQIGKQMAGPPYIFQLLIFDF